MAETDAASAITASVSTAVTYAIGAASTADSATQVFNPLFGYRISDPTVLTGTPVTGSVVRWGYTAPAAGSAVKVETSINGGLSWDLATNNAPVPRLRTGDTTTQAVLSRVTLSRLAATDTAPRVQFLEVQVSCDASTDELVPIAYGVITEVEAKSAGGKGSSGGAATSSGGVTARGGGQSGGGTNLTIKGVDLSRQISKNVWTKPFVVNGINYADAIKAMVLDRLPGQELFSITSTERVCPLLIYGLTQGSDPWQDIRDLAAAIGYECFFDAAGVFVLRPVPDPRVTPPVWVFDENSNPTVVEATRQLTDEMVFNYVVVKGESTSSQNAVSAVAFDNDPASRTYVYGPYGQHGVVVTLASVLTTDQAQAAANAILYNSLGASDTTTLSTVPMPALEVGDVVTVSVGDVKADGRYVITAVTTPLSPGQAQTLTCFRQSAQE